MGGMERGKTFKEGKTGDKGNCENSARQHIAIKIPNCGMRSSRKKPN